MINTLKRLLFPFVAMVSTLGVGAGVAVAAESSNDVWTPVNTAVSATSTDSAFVAGGTTVSCQSFTLSGTTPAGNGTTFPDNSTVNVNATVSGSCSPLGVNITFHNPWSLTLKSNSGGDTTCPVDGDNSDDCFVLTLPNNAATIVVATCTITVNATTVVAPYEDDNPYTATVTNATINISHTGFCPGVGSTATFNGHFSVSPGLLDE
jgi:hypothetical protein